MQLLSSIRSRVTWGALAVLLGLSAVLALGWTVHALKLKANLASAVQEVSKRDARIAEYELSIKGYQMAAKYSQDKLNEHVSRADRNWSADKRFIEELAALPKPQTPEAARDWVADAFQKERR